MWYEILPSMGAMAVAFALMEVGPMITHYASWMNPMMRRPIDEPSDNWIRRDQRIADTVLRMRWPANHHYTVGLDAIPDEGQPITRFQDYRYLKPSPPK
ncbi:unnamed protein product [Oppiella nova]|uniref:NADH dehydrogenase [ubiquinone] 1 alpha subcomplex subunit 1 n=1 Tax=Oppiella nova TaxID=334625 RepID=A0A7R9MKK5_9ACAR|nr:unnamed protein product [Oppiella nova]CAG2179099.1 unnamed protein product [Oppiella nova]